MRLLRKLLKTGWVLLALMASVPPGLAQVEVGNDLKMNLNGTLGFGYGGGFGTVGQSNHSVNWNGNGILSGSYYNPSFLSFNVQPYYNRNQNNAQSQSIFDESGVISSANIFTGSRFPGFVSYGRNFNSSGEFGIPGISGLTTNGSGHNFTIGWGAFVPDLPTLSLSYTTSANSSSVLGAEGDIHSATRVFNLNSTYKLVGFNLNGFYTHQNLDLNTPAFLGIGSAPSESSSSSSTYGILASHTLPLSGNFSFGFNRTTYDIGSLTSSSDGSTNTADAMATINPTRKLSLMGEMRYTGNLVGALQQSLTTAGGGPVVLLLGGGKSHSFGTSAMAYYTLGHGFAVNGRVNRQSQYYNGQTYDFTQYGGTLNYNYSRPLFGLLYFSFGMVDNAQQSANNGLSLTGNVGMQRRFGNWETSADFAYAQNVQTLIATYTTNNLSYGAYVRRRINSGLFWTGTYRGTQGGLLQDHSPNNRANNFSSSLGWHRYTLTGNYSRSHGRTILTPNGLLTPAPIPGLIEDLILFNGKSYSIGVGASPLRRMSLSINYTNASSDLLSSLRNSVNRSQLYYSRLDYNFRKLVLRAGFTRAHQGISASGLPPTTVNSYFVGISRWFNVF